METSILIAQIMALVYISVGIGGILDRDYFRRLIDDFYVSAGLNYTGGLIALTIGALIVHYHNHWVADWTVLITILGWMALLKGVVLIAFPSAMLRISSGMFGERWLKSFPYVTLVLGMVFAWFGFVAG